MKDNIVKKDNECSREEIGRREALKKAGKYAAITSATFYFVLSPKAKAEEVRSAAGTVESWESLD